MRKPTISEIKSRIRTKQPYFFDRKTMKAFGQTIGMFKIAKSPKGRIFIYAPGYDTERGQRRLMGYTFREFTGDDLKIIPGTTSANKEDILKYIRNH